MIDQDLKDGVNKSEMAVKYGIKPWEVDEMFKHPLLKGRRPARKRALSFNFVDDMSTPEITGIPNGDTMSDTDDEEYVDPNQVTLEDAIDEAIESVEEVKDQMQETQEAIVNMLSPTELETPAESLLKAEADATMSRVEEQDWIDAAAKEEELEDEDDNTFEL
jgi:hypothetical protein